MHQRARAIILSSLLHCINYFFAFSFAQTLGGILYPHPSKQAVSLHLPPTSSLLSLSWARQFPGLDFALWTMKMK